MPSDSTFVEVKNAFQAIAGLESLTAADEFFLTSSVNRAVHRAYNESDSWPRYLVVGEERLLFPYKLSGGDSLTSTLVNQNFKFFGLAEAGTVSIGGTKVYNGADGLATSNTLIYKTTGNAWVVATNVTSSVNSSGIVSFGDTGTVQYTETDTIKNDAVEDVKIWNPRGGASKLKVLTQNLIPYVEGGSTSIGEFLRIYRSKPFVNNSALEYEFYVDSLGCNVLNLRSSTAHSVFVNYKKELTTNYTPDSTDIPSEFVDYIIYTALSDFYTGDGQAEKAALAANQANAMLDIELLRLDKKANNNTINKRFSTYVNRQAR